MRMSSSFVGWVVLVAAGSMGACSAGNTGAPSDGADTPPPGTGDPADASSRDGSDTGTSGPGTDGPDGGGEGDGPDAEVTVPFVYESFDVNHVLSTGQSNAVANDGVPVLTKTQPFTNVMFDVGVMPSGSCDGDGCTVYQKPSHFVPLVEGDSFFYPVETMSSGLANEVSNLVQAHALIGGQNHDVLVSNHGRSGNSYWCLRKGGCGWWPNRGYVEPFDSAMKEVADGLAISKAAGKSYVVRAVTAVHGEHDHYAAASGDSAFPLPGTDGVSTIHDYGEGLEEWQRDYEAGARAITGQTLPVPLFVNQYSHWNNVPTTVIAYQQLAAHVRSKGKVIVVGPTYVLPYSDDCLHFTSEGERHLGEYFAKAYARVILEGKKWEPLRPLQVSLAGNVVTVKFLVPKPPLVFDTVQVKNPGNYGFEYVDEGASPPGITDVAIVGADTVKITLASAPTGGNKRIRYAYTFRGCGGSGDVARGNLRDSDDTPSLHGYDLSNWSVHFDEAIP